MQRIEMYLGLAAKIWYELIIVNRVCALHMVNTKSSFVISIFQLCVVHLYHTKGSMTRIGREEECPKRFKILILQVKIKESGTINASQFT